MPDENRYVWHPLRDSIKKHHPSWQAIRLESSVGIGIPDVNLFIPDQTDWWIELKHVDKLTPNLEIGLRKEQYVWMLEAWRVGRHVALVARIGDEWLVWIKPEAWAYARYSVPWNALFRIALRAHDPEAVIRYLHDVGNRGKIK